MVLAVAHPWLGVCPLSISLPQSPRRFSLQPSCHLARPTLVVLSPVASTSVSSLSPLPRSFTFCDAAAACRAADPRTWKHLLGVQSLAARPGLGSYEAHPVGQTIGIGLRAREP